MKFTNRFLKAGTPPALIILIYMCSVGPFGDTEYTASLPHIAHSLGAPYSLAQITMTSYLLGYAVSQLFYGPFSDRFGRRPIMMIGASIFMLGSLICIFSPSIWFLIFGRLIQGVGACAGGVISNAAVRDAFPPEVRGRVYAKINAAFAVAPGLGPVVGALIETAHLPWQMNFVVLFGLSTLLLLLLLFFFPETNRHLHLEALHPKKFFKNYFAVFKDPYFSTYCITMGLAIGCVYTVLIEAPSLILNILHKTPLWFAIVAICIVGGFVFGALLTNLLLHTRLNKNQNWIIFMGLMLILISSLVLYAFAHFGVVSFLSIVIPISFVFTGVAFIIPVGTNLAIAPFESIAGSASAVIGFFQMGLASLSTAAISMLHTGTLFALPIMYIILSVFGLLIFTTVVLIRPDRPRHVV